MCGCDSVFIKGVSNSNGPGSIMKFQWSGKPSVELLPGAPYSACDPVHQHSLGVALQRQQGVHAIGTDHRTDFDTWPGTLAFTPPGVDVFSESQTGGEYLIVRWTADAAGGLDEVPMRRWEWPAHRSALRKAHGLRRLLLATERDELAIEESLLQLINLERGQGMPPLPHLRPVYRRVLDRIAAEFDQPLTIAELAISEDKNPLLFLREFSKLVGTTPHAFIVECRVQAARAMIQREDRPLSSIAADCGFTHQSHMGTAFRKILGQTPGEYRRHTSFHRD
jgi:AraC family transcriptional regulator